MFIILVIKCSAFLPSVVHDSLYGYFNEGCPRAKRKSRIQARKAAGNRYENSLIC